MGTVLDTQEIEVQQSPTPSQDLRTHPNALFIVRSGSRERALFSDGLLQSSSHERQRRSVATIVSFIFQCVVVATLLILPLMFTEALPTERLLTYLVAPPPPPPPPPPPAAAHIVKAVQSDTLSTGQLRIPT